MNETRPAEPSAKDYAFLWVIFCIGLALYFSLACSRLSSMSREEIQQEIQKECPPGMYLEICIEPINLLLYDAQAWLYPLPCLQIAGLIWYAACFIDFWVWLGGKYKRTKDRKNEKYF